MALTIGTHIGSYEIVSAIGAGGMGEVYRARDTKLGRDVAVKILPALFASDPDRLARFEREAKTLAGLNHPNIAAIYGIEDGGPTRALVMELVAGEDLSTRIARGPVLVSDALQIAGQIALALEAAHDVGIVHRDLKPANVKVREDGTVKVLDFGLAKGGGATDDRGPRTEEGAAPTMTSPAMTAMGMIIGTAAYMSPEQARGKVVDRRADIWAFGVVLYEMLTGRRAFEGEEISDVLAAVLRQDLDWTALPADTPAPVRRLLRRCLEKDPKRRLSAIGDARLEIEETDEPRDGASVRARSSRAPMFIGAVAGALLTAAIAAAVWTTAPRAPASPADITRLSIVPPDDRAYYSDPAEHAISPDGRMVAFVIGEKVSFAGSQIWIRSLETLTARRLPGGEGGHMPFWSPDSRRVGFFADAKLKTAAIDGERADVICDASSGRGGTWGSANVIVFAPDGAGPLFKVSANGGDPSPVTTLDTAKKEVGHRFPVFLPDGDHFLFAALPGRGGKFDIFAGSLAGGAPELVGPMETSPAYVDPGWLLFMRQGALAAQRFDPVGRTLTGEAVALPDEPGGLNDIASSWTAGQVASVSRTGSLAYLTDPPVDTKPVFIDVSGTISPAVDLPKGRYSSVSVSPNGSQAVVVRQSTRTESTLWLINLARGGVTPLTVARGQQAGVVWSPEGRRIIYMSDRDGWENLYSKDVAGGGPEVPFLQSPAPFKQPDSWSPDGKWVVFRQLDPDTFQNVWALETSTGAKPVLLAQGPGRELAARVSPDGRWLAYLSDESGRVEIYLQPFPASGGVRVPVTTEGVTNVWWGKDSRRVFAVNGSLDLLAIDIEWGSSPRGKPPRRLGALPRGMVALDVMPDRTRFLALVPATTAASSITVVQNWQRALDAKR